MAVDQDDTAARPDHRPELTVEPRLRAARADMMQRERADDDVARRQLRAQKRVDDEAGATSETAPRQVEDGGGGADADAAGARRGRPTTRRQRAGAAARVDDDPG